MELFDYELELQSEIVSWKCSRDVDCIMEFIPEPRHVKLGMKGLVWSIGALPLPLRVSGCSSFSFNTMDAKKSSAPLALSADSKAPNLPAKFRLLLEIFKVSIKSVSHAEEALDKFYAFSRLYSLAEEDKLWEIVADAEISAAACTTAREVIQQAAEAAAAFLLDIKPPRPVSSKAKAKKMGLKGTRSGHRGIRERTIAKEPSGGIRERTIAEEPSGAFPMQGWEAISRPFKVKAVEQGNVLQWCNVKELERMYPCFVFDVEELERMYPCFEFEVALQEFFEGDDLIQKIGLVNDRALKVRVLFREDAHANVVCSQEEVETQASFGLTYLLPNIIRDYIEAALEKNDFQQNNIVEGILQHVAGYLVSLPSVCVICGTPLPFCLPWSVCSDICKARQQVFADALPWTKSSEDSWECDDNALPTTNGWERDENTLPRSNSWETNENTLPRTNSWESNENALRRTKISEDSWESDEMLSIKCS